MLKIVTLFLVVMVVGAMVSRWRIGGSGLSGPKLPRPGKPQKCPSCGRFLIGSGPCECRAKG